MSTTPSTVRNRPPEVDAASIVPKPSGYRDNLRYKPRENGTGYGRSSGYARDRQYADNPDVNLFRCS